MRFWVAWLLFQVLFWSLVASKSFRQLRLPMKHSWFLHSLVDDLIHWLVFWTTWPLSTTHLASFLCLSLKQLSFRIFHCVLLTLRLNLSDYSQLGSLLVLATLIYRLNLRGLINDFKSVVLRLSLSCLISERGTVYLILFINDVIDKFGGRWELTAGSRAFRRSFQATQLRRQVIDCEADAPIVDLASVHRRLLEAG